MELSAILGSMGTVIGLVRALPQLFRLLGSGTALGVSVDTALTSAMVSFGWALYGVITGQPFVALATGSSGVVFLVTAMAALRFGRRVTEVRITLVWCLVLVLAFLFKREAGLAMVLPVSILVSNLPQIWTAIRESDLTDLSLGTWVLSEADGLVWGLYSLVRQDTAIMVFALFQAVTSGAIIFLKLADNRKRAARYGSRDLSPPA